MPTETRVITFTNDEIKEAITSYCVKTGRLAPNIGVTAPIFFNDGQLNASFEPVPAGPKVNFQENEIAAAVILHCKKHGIPIARRSIKSLRVAKNVVSLHLDTPL